MAGEREALVDDDRFGISARLNGDGAAGRDDEHCLSDRVEAIDAEDAAVEDVTGNRAGPTVIDDHGRRCDDDGKDVIFDFTVGGIDEIGRTESAGSAQTEAAITRTGSQRRAGRNAEDDRRATGSQSDAACHAQSRRPESFSRIIEGAVRVETDADMIRSVAHVDVNLINAIAEIDAERTGGTVSMAISKQGVLRPARGGDDRVVIRLRQPASRDRSETDFSQRREPVRS